MSPTGTSPTRESVVDAAAAIYATTGAVGVGHRTVAAALDCPEAVVRAAFPDVIDLVVAVLESQQRHWTAGLAAAAAGAADPRDEILSVFGYLEDCFEDDAWRGCAFINGYGELGRVEPAVAVLAAEHFASVEEHLAALCVEAGLPAHVSDGLSLLVQGAKVESAIDGTAKPARSARLTAATLIAVYDSERAADDFI